MNKNLEEAKELIKGIKKEVKNGLAENTRVSGTRSTAS